MASKVAADLYFDIKTDITQLKKGLADAKKETRRAATSIRKAHKESFDKMGNDVVRYVRKLETIVVALYGVKKAYDVTLGRGMEFNKMMEQEQAGLALMITQKLKDVDITGKQVTATEKFAYAQQMAAKEMEKVREINVETPHTLGQTAQLYKVIRGQMLAFGGDANQTAEMVKNLSLAGAAGNVEFSSMVKTLDQLFSGKMKASDMQLALQNILEVSQEEVRSLKSSADVIEYLQKKLGKASVAAETMRKSWLGVTSNFTNAWDTIAAELQKPIFDYMKKEITSITKTLQDSKTVIVDTVKGWAKSFKDLLPILGEVVIALGAIELAVIALNNVAKASAFVGMGVAIAGTALALAAMNDEFVKTDNVFREFVNMMITGWKTLVNVFDRTVLKLVEGLNVYYKAYQVVTENMPIAWENMAIAIRNTWGELMVWLEKKFMSWMRPTMETINWAIEAMGGTGAALPDASSVSFTPEKKKDYVAGTGIKNLIDLKKYQDAVTKSTAEMGKAYSKWKYPVKEVKAVVAETKKQEIGIKDVNGKLAENATASKKAGGAAKAAAKEAAEAIDKMLEPFGAVSKLQWDQELKKQAENAADAMEELSETIAGGLADGFEAVISGDIQGAFQSLFKSMITEGVKALAKSVIQAQLTGQAWSLAAIAHAAAESTWVGMAAMAAAMAALGFATGSFGGSAPDISQAQMDTATGANLPKSDTVENSLKSIEENGKEGLTYSRRMANSLDALVMLSDKASAAVGSSLSGKDYDATGKNSDTIWGGKTYDLISSGIMIDPASIEDFKNGVVQGNEYMIEKVTKSSWFGLSSKESLKQTNLGPADTQFMDAYTAAFNSGVEALSTAAEVLGVTEEQFNQFTASWEMTMQNLNFEGLDAEGRAALIQESLGAQLDSLADTLIAVSGYVEEFKRGGEGTAETIIRLANEFEVVKRTMTDIAIVMPQVAQGGVAFSQALIGAFGSMSKFAGFMNWFTNTFYSDEERLEMATVQLRAAFASVNLTLPATREGFKALTLELINHLKAVTIDLEAQRALVKSQIMSSKSTLELAKTSGQSALAIYEAAVAAGAGAMVAAGAAAEAVAILGNLEAMSETIQEQLSMLEANMGNLDIVFGDVDTSVGDLGSSVGDLGSSAGAVGSACDSATESMEALYASLLDVSGLKAQWMDDLAGAEMMVRMAEKSTGLTGLTYDNFITKFQAALDAAGGSMSMLQEEFDKWSTMSGYIRAYQDLLDSEKEEKLNKEMEVLKAQISFYEDVLKSINDAYLGSLSYLNSMEKAQYAASAAQKAFDDGDTQSYIDNLGKQLDYEKRMSVTKEDYMSSFDSYIDELKKSEPEATMDDAVDELQSLNDKIDDLQDAVEKASYQGA